MELLTSLAIGVLVGCGIYLLLQRELLRVVLGTVLISHGANLMLFISGGVKRGGPPILGDAVTAAAGTPAYTDPLPQALILTAIVIGFATTAFVLVLAYRAYQAHGTDDTEGLRSLEDPHE
ncbi:Na(+)/H(+) antiporter subunit C [Limnochorda pilosa]|uniref:Monovalent cation/H+ antiporter subunit C n=1 Tax=Limnochorda pilosa TaxID=1555112 RepID=A0A0K2SKR6_LIMPI|nr:Na(+)/H(+) antiporter subunit C [Limnochorda pilosa]BAS27680.1 monovalent cation/H+ antiporter subunit C [Limnochorda pilosa]